MIKPFSSSPVYYVLGFKSLSRLMNFSNRSLLYYVLNWKSFSYTISVFSPLQYLFWMAVVQCLEAFALTKIPLGKSLGPLYIKA